MSEFDFSGTNIDLSVYQEEDRRSSQYRHKRSQSSFLAPNDEAQQNRNQMEARTKQVGTHDQLEGNTTGLGQDNSLRPNSGVSAPLPTSLLVSYQSPVRVRQIVEDFPTPVLPTRSLILGCKFYFRKVQTEISSSFSFEHYSIPRVGWQFFLNYNS